MDDTLSLPLLAKLAQIYAVHSLCVLDSTIFPMFATRQTTPLYHVCTNHQIGCIYLTMCAQGITHHSS